MQKISECFMIMTDNTKHFDREGNKIDFENMPEGISIFNNKGQYTLFNKLARKMIFPSYEYMGKIGDEIFDQGLGDVFVIRLSCTDLIQVE